jgi:GT2 family glycosyltransferase
MTSTAMLLESEAASLLQAGDAAGAFRAADRRLRLKPHPEAHCHVLHAEALQGLGETQAAVASLHKALEERPADPATNRRLLAWGSSDDKRAAAAALVAVERHPSILRACVTRLLAHRPAGTARVTVLHDRVTGWAAWSETESAPHIVIKGDFGEVRSTLVADPDHFLAANGRHAAGFDLIRPASPAPVTVIVRSGTLEIARASGTPNTAPTPDPVRRAPAKTPDRRPIAIIVPIYGDAATTRACLDSLLAQTPLPGVSSIILVDDASPDAAIVALAEAAATNAQVLLLRNTRNLGFVGAVNRALDEVEDCDVILLNADTVVPPGFIERLADAAYAAPDIGTVTPLSNNGEIVSHPVIGKVNPLPSAAEITRIDGLAARVNAGRTVDIPSGIGFCLYVRHDCLAAVGHLRELYHRGYYEDVDLCLTARERGYRNVCATSVFVGHAGTRSFRADKRALVVQNSQIAARRFPDHSPETAAFMAADPLRSDRARIERAALAADGPFTLLVAGQRIGADTATPRALWLATQTEPRPLLMIAEPDGAFALTCPEDRVRAIRLRVEPGPALEETMAFLRMIGIARVEFLDPARTPMAFARALLTLDAPVRIVLADPGLAAAASTGSAPRRGKTNLAIRPGWDAILDKAHDVIAPTATAQAFWRQLGAAVPALAAARARQPAPAPVAMARDGLLGMIPAGRSVHETMLVEELAAGLGLAERVIVLGEPAPVLELPETIVQPTGVIKAEELADLVRHLRLKALLLVASEPVLSHAIWDAARHLPIPVASIDWFGGGRRPRAGDLALQPDAPRAAWVLALRRWLAP